MKAEDPTPLLVIGLNRSGTKWLSNLLCRHPAVYGVQTARHGGVLETNMFDAMSSVVGDIRIVENYVALVELWSQTDFVVTAGVEKEFLYALRPRPTNCFAMFRRLMDEAARRGGARFWLQKTSPLEGRAALRALPDARVIVIERDVVDTLESRIQLRRNRGTGFSVARGAIESVYQRKLLDRIRRRHAVIEVEYGKLRDDTEGVLRQVCVGLGLGFEPALLESDYRPNTSFAGRRDGRRVLTRSELWTARLIAAGGALVPTPLLDGARSLFRNRSPHLVPGTFAQIADRHQLGESESSAADPR